MAGKVIWHISMSLDCFIAGPSDAMDWAFERASEPSPEADEVIPVHVAREGQMTVLRLRVLK